MARVLFGVMPSWGHVNPMLAIAQRLQEAGHAVAFACHPKMALALQKAGVELVDGFRWGDRLIELQPQVGQTHRRLPSPRTVLLGPRDAFFSGLDQAVPDLIAAMRLWRPDVLVCDAFFPPGPIAAEVCGVPYATTHPFIPWPSSREVPPWGLGLPPRGRPHWAWPVLRAILNWYAHSADKVVNQVRRRYDLPLARRAFLISSPYLNLIFTTEAFDYSQPDPPPTLYYVGPCISHRRFDSDIPFPVDRLDGRPALYATAGSLYGGASFFDKVVEASREQPWQMVVSVGPHQDVSRWANAPENVLVRNWVPHRDILPRMKAVIAHGGMNTVTEVLAAGLPLVLVPAGSDQFENARRVVEAGAGVMLYPNQVTVEELRGACRRILKDGTCRENALRIAADYARCDGPGTSATLILRLAQAGAPLLRRAGQRATVYAHQVGSGG